MKRNATNVRSVRVLAFVLVHCLIIDYGLCSVHVQATERAEERMR